MKKRTFLFSALAIGGALVVGWGFMPPRQRLQGALPLPVKDGQIALNAWLVLDADGSVGLVMPRSEMGQGAHTGLAMLVAEELDCALSQIKMIATPIDKIYGNVAGLAEGVPFHPDDQGVVARSMRWTMHKIMREMGFMMTGGSASIKDLWVPLREASAMMRASLVAAVASHWNVAASEIQIANGEFSHSSGKKLTLGEVVKQLGARVVPAAQYTPKTAASYKVIGQPLKRIEASAKVDGTAGFGIDTVLPNMLYAAIKMSPTLGGQVTNANTVAAEKMPGVKKVVRFNAPQNGSGGVAVIATHYWQARKALEAIDVQWDTSPMANLSSVEVTKTLLAAIEKEDGFSFYKTGDVDAALKAAKSTLKAQYTAPYLAHATLEPMNCTVHFADGKASVYVPTQTPDFARNACAKALGIAPEMVTINVTYLGGGFGRRLEADYVSIAASIAKQLPGQPIQVLWSREEDMRHDFFRPAAVAQFEASFDANHQIQAWLNKSAGQNIVPQYMARNANLPAAGPDKSSSEGAFDQAYELPNARISHVAVDLPTPIGFWRSVGHSHQAFFKEGFIDECAAQGKQDPYAYRAALLKNHPRHKAVLDLAASKSGWGTALSPAADGANKARGIALHESFGSIVAQVAEVSLSKEGAIRVHKVVCAIDCGLAVNPNLIAQQVESSIVFGLSAALYGKIDIEKGQVAQSNFHDYPLLRLNESPTIETHIVSSTRPPEGVGEPALPPIAPAVANAVFALNGKRLRNLPLKLA